MRDEFRKSPIWRRRRLKIGQFFPIPDIHASHGGRILAGNANFFLGHVLFGFVADIRFGLLANCHAGEISASALKSLAFQNLDTA